MSDAPSYATLRLTTPKKRNYAIAAAFVAIVFAALALWLHIGYQRSEALRLQTAQSCERQIALVRLLSRIAQAEQAERGYLLTGNAALLAPLDLAFGDIAAQVATIADGPRRVTHMPQIKQGIGRMAVERDRTIVLSRTGRRAEALASASTGPARHIVDRLGAEIGAEIEVEANASKARELAILQQRAKLHDLILLIMALCATTFAGVLASMWHIARNRHGAILDAFETATGSASVFDTTVDAVLILDPSGKIEVMNAAAVTLLGYFVDAADRRDIATIIDIAPGEGTFHQRLGLIDGQLQRTQLSDRVIRDRLGREVPVDIAMGVLHASNGDRVIVSLHDISERKRLDRVKDELMSTVSHEIRTPLTSIIGSLGLLRTGAAGNIPDGATRLIDIAENNSRRLIRLIDDMLDIDRIESGKLRVERAAIDLRDVLARARIGSEGIARAHAVVLACNAPAEPVTISGDADRLLQVISNLVANAIHVAPKGSMVDLTLSIDAHGCALVTVADRGPGVPLAFRTRIFGRFERAARDDGAKGTGLGLAISREIVTLHAGRIWFEDRPGGGTCFTFSLPMLDTMAGNDPAAVSVLICCDRQALCDMFASMVDATGCRYDVVRSSAQAQAAIASRDYALALVDLDLSGGGGLALARSMREHDLRIEQPVLLVSARTPYGSGAPTPLDLVALIETHDADDRLSIALRSGLARRGSDGPVILHFADDHDRIATVARAAAALEPDVRVIVARDLPAVRTALATVTPDLVVVDLARPRDRKAAMLPVLPDPDGLAIPTILHIAAGVSPDQLARAEAILVAPARSVPNLAATLRRALPAHVQSLPA